MKMIPTKNWNKTDPPPQIPWAWIISKKIEAKEDHHTNQHPTLSRGKTRKVGISRRRAALDGGRRIRPQPDSGREAHDKICSRSICEGSLSHTVHKPSATWLPGSRTQEMRWSRSPRQKVDGGLLHGCGSGHMHSGPFRLLRRLGWNLFGRAQARPARPSCKGGGVHA